MWIARSGAASRRAGALARRRPARARASSRRRSPIVEEGEFVLLYSAPLYAPRRLGPRGRVLGRACCAGEAEASLRATPRSPGAASTRCSAPRAARSPRRTERSSTPARPPRRAARRRRVGVHQASLGRGSDFRFHAAVCGWREAEALLTAERRAHRAREPSSPPPPATRARSRRSRCWSRSKRSRGARGWRPPSRPPRRRSCEQTGLSPRELDVFALMADGRTNRGSPRAVHQPEDRQRPRVAHPRQARRQNRAEAATRRNRPRVPARGAEA